ncbi:adenylate kinase [Buchnera aphidicola (Aphis helianthi)]|uniref:Adenylate kinase n=1 Tax=Buchnera aphidicola (Aphis helianthi) TaxID=2315802 RepID=A0A4D6XQR1_9GAMM|nr:adenylate kinase [Buchnera aphidicola]QCI17287.1 adenylate kinase [Buchnera aphidicola (Aphis helianthi)]
MHIILLGAPGTGKGTQSKFIVKKYNIPQISTGDILREHIQLKNKIGKRIFNILKNGELVSDNIVCDLVYQRIQKKDCIQGFLLDGFPRTIKQAKYISHLGIKINFVFEFIVPDQLILQRISGRRIHIQSGRTYHIQFNPPQEDGKDDITKENLIIREDDKIKSIQNRLENYKKNNSILTKFYLKEDKLKKLKFFKINGTEKPDTIQKKIQIILEENKN